jgi:hypothetical protein
VADYLVTHGMGESVIAIGQALGGPREQLSKKTAQAIHMTRENVDPLNTLGIEIKAARGARIVPLIALASRLSSAGRKLSFPASLFIFTNELAANVKAPPAPLTLMTSSLIDTSTP